MCGTATQCAQALCFLRRNGDQGVLIGIGIQIGQGPTFFCQVVGDKLEPACSFDVGILLVLYLGPAGRVMGEWTRVALNGRVARTTS